MEKYNSIFCTAPFTTLRIESYSKASNKPTREFGTVYKPACVYKPTQKCSSLEEYLNGRDMEDHRQNLIHGTEPRSNCIDCSGAEAQGMTSVRQYLLKKPWVSDIKDIKLLDVNFGNTCNLGCLMCSEEASSYIANERYKVGLLDYQIGYKNIINTALDTIDNLPNLESVSFIGGEFFLVEDNLQILDRIQQRNITATVFTNATVINLPLLEKLKQIPKLELQISVDSTDDCYEFIRYPAKWQTVEKNIFSLIKQLPHADIHCTAVFQLLNVQYLHELYDWANRRRIDLKYLMLVTPRYMSFNVLTDQERTLLADAVAYKQTQKYFIAKPQTQTIDQIIESIKQSKFDFGLRSQFVDFMSRISLYRKLDHAQILKQFGVLTELSKEVIDNQKKVFLRQFQV